MFRYCAPYLPTRRRWYGFVTQEGSETDNGWQNDVLVPLQTPFRVITWAAPKFSAQASQFVAVPHKNHKQNFGPALLASPIGHDTQLTDSEYAECRPISLLFRKRSLRTNSPASLWHHSFYGANYVSRSFIGLSVEMVTQYKIYTATGCWWEQFRKINLPHIVLENI